MQRNCLEGSHKSQSSPFAGVYGAVLCGSSELPAECQTVFSWPKLADFWKSEWLLNFFSLPLPTPVNLLWDFAMARTLVCRCMVFLACSMCHPRWGWVWSAPTKPAACQLSLIQWGLEDFFPVDLLHSSQASHSPQSKKKKKKSPSLQRQIATCGWKITEMYMQVQKLNMEIWKWSCWVF